MAITIYGWSTSPRRRPRACVAVAWDSPCEEVLLFTRQDPRTTRHLPVPATHGPTTAPGTAEHERSRRRARPRLPDAR
jgi:hypothetical protein